MLREALNYAKLGYSIVPLKPSGKEPLIPWQEFQKRKASEDEIRIWFQKCPEANIGVVTGIISNCVVADADGAEGLKTLAELKLESLRSSLTGNGKHLWFKHPGHEVKGSVRLYPGLDIRGDGNYIVAPPSVHESGRRYRFLGRTSVSDAGSLPPFPASLIVVPASIQRQNTSNEPDWIVKSLEEMTDGNIDVTLFRICSWFRNAGATESTCAAFVRPYAERVNAASGHLEDKIRNVWRRYEPRLQTLSPMSNNIGKLVLHNPSNPDSLKEYNNRTQSSSMGAKTGYSKLDSLTKGLRPGELFTLAARTGVGKTNWILPVIKTFCATGKKGVLFSTETSFDQIWNRYRGLLPDGRFEHHLFFVCDEFTPNPERIEEALKEVMPDLFVFDHINHVGTDYHQISKFMMSLKELARKFNIPGIVTAQLSRLADWVEKGEKVTPRLSMIKGSGAIEEVSAQVLLLHEKRVHDTHTEIEGILDKNRYGEKGQLMFGLFKNPYEMREL